MCSARTFGAWAKLCRDFSLSLSLLRDVHFVHFPSFSPFNRGVRHNVRYNIYVDNMQVKNVGVLDFFSRKGFRRKIRSICGEMMRFVLLQCTEKNLQSD
jgi:hypothetical protein